MRRAWAPVALTLVFACRPKDAQLSAPADAALVGQQSAVRPSPPPPAGPRGRTIVAEDCLSCHSIEIIEQQRLTPAQWEKVVKKMAGWGANLAAEDQPIVTAYLAARYGVDGGAYEVGYIDPAQASSEIVPQEDGPFAGGDADRGGSLYSARCASCHAADARGQIGTILVDRPLLYRAADFARTIREGRAKMPAQPATTEQDIADLLAHLRRLRPSL